MISKKRKLISSSFLYTHLDGVGDDAELNGAALGVDVVIQGAGITIQHCVLDQSIVRGAMGIQVRHCRWKVVDAANADMERSGWRESVITASRFTGVNMNSSHIAKCTFEECKMNLLQCQLATLQDVHFHQCDLRGAYFNGSTLAGTVFDGSDLTGADFPGASITGCDFRRANIEDIRVSPAQMAGVIVTSDQALYLARLFGLDIRE